MAHAKAVGGWCLTEKPVLFALLIREKIKEIIVANSQKESVLFLEHEILF